MSDDVQFANNNGGERVVKAKRGLCKRMCSEAPSARCSRTPAVVQPSSSSVPLKAAGKYLGVHFYRLIGRGRSGAVYEVSDNHHATRERLAGKLCVAGDTKADSMRRQAEQESRLAGWAASKKLGPQVQALRTSVVPCGYEEEPVHAALLLMDKASTCLHTLGLSGALAEVQRAWQLTFDLLATSDFSITADAEMGVADSGWLCCDDLKPENVLVHMLGADGERPPQTAPPAQQRQVTGVCLTDWDTRHCHPLPLCREWGCLVNRLVLVFNCVVRWHRQPSERAADSLLRTLAAWPDQERALARDLGILAAAQNKVLLQFLVALDAVFLRGPYYYARVCCKGRRERAKQFMDAYASAMRSCPPSSEDCPGKDPSARSIRRQLAEITKILRRSCLSKRCTQAAAGQSSSASPKAAHVE